MKLNDREIAYLQDKWSIYEIFYDFVLPGQDRVEEKKEPDFKEFTESILDDLVNSVNETLDILAPFDVLFSLREIDRNELDKYMIENEDLIRGEKLKPLISYDDIIHITAPTGETLLMDLGDRIYANEAKETNLAGLAILVDKDSNILREPIYIKVKYKDSAVRNATEFESEIINTARTFYRLNRKLGEFKDGDLLINNHDNSYRLFNSSKDSEEEVFDGILNERLSFGVDKDNLKYMVDEHMSW